MVSKNEIVRILDHSEVEIGEWLISPLAVQLIAALFLETNYDAIDEVLYLQGYAEGWKDRKYEIKYDRRDCIINDPHYKFIDGLWYDSTMLNWMKHFNFSKQFQSENSI